MTEQAAALSDAVGRRRHGGDGRRRRDRRRHAAATRRLVLATSQDVIERLGGDAGTGRRRPRHRVEAAEVEATAISRRRRATTSRHGRRAWPPRCTRSPTPSRSRVGRSGRARATVRGRHPEHRPGHDRADRLLRAVVDRAAAAAPRAHVRRAVARPRSASSGCSSCSASGRCRRSRSSSARRSPTSPSGLAVGGALVSAAVFALGVPLQGSILWVAATVVARAAGVADARAWSCR